MSRSWWPLEVVRRAGEADEVARDQGGALVDQLEVGVLAVRARRAPHDRSGRRAHRRSVAGHALAVGLHVELLEVGREACQVVAVGQDRVRGGAEEVGVPDPDQARGAPGGYAPTEPSRSARPWSRKPASISPKPSGPIAIIRRQPDRRVEASSGRRPSPRTRTCSRCRCRIAATSAAFVETATKCAATASSPSAADQPPAGTAGVGERLDGGEGLRADHEERLGGVEVVRSPRRCRCRRHSTRSAPSDRAGRRRAGRRRPWRGRGPSRRCRC